VHRTLFRDIDQFFETPGLDALRAALGEQRQRQRDVLAQNWLVPMNREAVIAAAIGHALDFWTWKSLTENQGLGDDDAATLMAQMVQGVADDQEFRTI
jgi:hypothetical protein